MEKKKKVTISIDADLYYLIVREAEENSRAISDYLRLLIEKNERSEDDDQ